MNDQYNDDYTTCEATYATLRVFHVDLVPEELDRLLGVPASQSHRRGDAVSARSPDGATRKSGGWLLTTEGEVDSRDSRRHIDWLFDRLSGKLNVLTDLQAKGYRIDIFCFWRSARGHGGPTVSPSQARRIAETGIGLSFDVYFNYDEAGQADDSAENEVRNDDSS